MRSQAGLHSLHVALHFSGLRPPKTHQEATQYMCECLSLRRAWRWVGSTRSVLLHLHLFCPCRTCLPIEGSQAFRALSLTTRCVCGRSRNIMFAGFNADKVKCVLPPCFVTVKMGLYFWVAVWRSINLRTGRSPRNTVYI